MTTDVIEGEDEAPARASSWSAALAQLPGFPPDLQAALPSPSAGAAREVSSAVEEDLAVDEDLALEEDDFA